MPKSSNYPRGFSPCVSSPWKPQAIIVETTKLHEIEESYDLTLELSELREDYPNGLLEG